MSRRRRQIHPQDRYGCFSLGSVCLVAATVLSGISMELGLIEPKSKRGRDREIPVGVDLANGRSTPRAEPREPGPAGQGTRDRFSKLRNAVERYRGLTGRELTQAIAADRKTFAVLAAIGMGTLAFAVIGMVGIVLLVRAVITVAKGRPVLVQTPGVGARWGLWECLVAPSFALVITMVIWTVLAIAKVKVGKGSPFSSLLPGVLICVYACYIVRRWYGQPISALGLHGCEFWRNVRRGIVGFAMIVPLMFASGWLNTAAYRRLVGPVPEHPITKTLLSSPPLAAVVVIILSVVFVGPFTEELVSRGLLCGALRRRFGSGWAIVVSAEVFAVLHFDLSCLLPHFVVGLALAYLYERTRSLVAPTVVHILQNATACGFALLVSFLD